jgi:hypothetical protein
MKKNITLILIFVFAFSLALNLPAKADDANINPTSGATGTPMVTSYENMTGEQRGNIDTSKLEKIPSPDYIRYFKQIIKKDGVMYGVRIEHNATATQAILKNNDKKASSSLEKIPSPAHINLFEKITKIGNALFGVKKDNPGQDKKDNYGQDKKSTSTIPANLEKITSLEQVSLFDKIVKIGNDLFGIRKNPIRQLPMMSTSTIACVTSAIDAKDTAVTTAFNTASAEVSSAIAARGTCQKAALSLAQNERLTAIAKCNQAFQETAKKSRETANASQKTAWETYRSSLKTCSASNEGNTAEIMIEDGGQNFTEMLKQ